MRGRNNTVILDARPLLGQLTGIGIYTLNLFRGLQGVKEVGVRAYIRGREERAKPFSIDRIVNQPRLLGIIDNMLYDTRSWWRRGIPLFHGTNFFLPKDVETGIITVHDLSVIRFPETHPIERVRDFNREFESSLYRATHILTDSEEVRKELLDYTGFNPEKVTAVHLGVSPKFRPFHGSSYQENTLSGYGLRADSYVLCVATLEPRKRIDAVVVAHMEMVRRTGSKTPLVLIGAVGWRNGELCDLINRGAADGSIILLGYVPREHLAVIYAAAKLFVYLSMYEGFGLPPIEAMASGVPTIVSNRSCLPEVTAGAAMLVDPDNFDECAYAIQRGLEDLPWRTHAKTAGLSVASGYTWEACVLKTLMVYKEFWNSVG